MSHFYKYTSISRISSEKVLKYKWNFMEIGVNMLLKKLIMIIIFLFYYLIFEILTLNALELGSFPNFIFLDISLILIICSVIFLIKSYKISFIYLNIWLLIFIILYLVNVVMIYIFGDIFSIDKLFLIGEANEVFDIRFLDKNSIILSLLLFISYQIINYLIITKFKTKKREIKFNKHILIFLLTIVFSLTIYFLINTKAKDNIKVYGRRFSEEFYISTLKKSAIKHYGIITFYLKETKLYLDINKTNNNQKNYHQVKSPYYGLLKDKNVITILIESGQEMAINPVLTPNLYQLRNEGLYFSENYSVNKTNVSEQIGMVGNYPTSTYLYSKRIYNFFFSLPNILNEKYVTSYFHDNNEAFYSRGKLLKEIGFENLYFHDDLFPEDLPNWKGAWSWNGDYTLDSITIERILPNMINENELFYSYWTTLSTHGPYDNDRYSNRDLFIHKGYFKEIEEAEKNGKWVNPLKGDRDGEFQFKYYQAAMIDLDIAIGKMLSYLSQKNLLDDTLIVLFSDHHVYYHELHLRLNDVPKEESYKMDLLYDSILYIWNPKLNEKHKSDFGTNKITTFTSPYIIVPTILDLLGASYNSDWYNNYSYFYEGYIPVFYSHQHQAFMDNVIYSIGDNKIKYQAKKVTKKEKNLFFFNCLLLLEKQYKVNELYKDYD